MFEAVQTAKGNAPEASPSDESLLVSKAEYLRLKSCLALIEKALAEYGTQESTP
jgi:hypothetical protein